MVRPHAGSTMVAWRGGQWALPLLQRLSRGAHGAEVPWTTLCFADNGLGRAALSQHFGDVQRLIILARADPEELMAVAHWWRSVGDDVPVEVVVAECLEEHIGAIADVARELPRWPRAWLPPMGQWNDAALAALERALIRPAAAAPHPRPAT